MKSQISAVRKLVGNITEEQLRYVDSFVGKEIVIFTPAGGACLYALSPRHSHPSYMFILPFNNQTSLVIGKMTVTAQPGRLFALSPDIIHHELPSEYPPRYIAVLIDKDFFKEQLSIYPLNKDVVFHGEHCDVSPELLQLLKRFMIEADNKIIGHEAVLSAMSAEICHVIIRSIFNISNINDRISSRMEIDRAVEFMHANLDKRINADNLAKVACMSLSHFSRIFKQETGKSPADYLGQIRMERVKKLLLAGEKSITEIALECGFKSSSYLSACFYKRFKTSPSEYCKKDRISKTNNRIAKALPR